MAKVFFSNQDILLLVVGFYLGTILTDLLKTFTKDIVIPLLSPLIAKDRAKDMDVKFFGATLEVGDFLFELMNAFVSVILVVLFVKVLRRYGGSWLKHFYV